MERKEGQGKEAAIPFSSFFTLSFEKEREGAYLFPFLFFLHLSSFFPLFRFFPSPPFVSNEKIRKDKIR